MKEDILRILGERNARTLLFTIKDEIKVAQSIMLKALEELEKDDLIIIQENEVLLTELGQKKAKTILEAHLVLENYFRKTRSKTEAHTAAHILEHSVSGEVINNIKKLSTLKKEGVPLTAFELNKRGMISEIEFSDFGLFERTVSMGLFPGESIMVMSEVPDGIVLKVGDKKFALDSSIAKGIKAVNYGKP